MKEEEAKTKKCPNMLTRLIDERGLTLGISDHCIASGCMMWQWEITTLINNLADRRQDDIKISKTEGCCGLAK